MDKVSVIMPCYNDGKYIEESIQSVQNQTYPHIEMIIIDDGSTDPHTKALLSQCQWANTKILHTPHLGPSAARNAGIKAATGKYILPLDADDIIAKDYIEKAVQAMQEDETRGIVYCEAALFGSQKGKWTLPPYSLERMLVDNVIFVTALFPKKAWEQVGGFDESLRYGMEDYDFWLALIEEGYSVYQIPEILFHYRKKPISRSKSFQKEPTHMAKTYQKIYDNHTRLYTQHARLYASAMREEWIKHVLLKKKLQASLGIFEKLAQLPSVKKQLKKLMTKVSGGEKGEDS